MMRRRRFIRLAAAGVAGLATAALSGCATYHRPYPAAVSGGYASGGYAVESRSEAFLPYYYELYQPYYYTHRYSRWPAYSDPRPRLLVPDHGYRVPYHWPRPDGDVTPPRYWPRPDDGASPVPRHDRDDQVERRGHPRAGVRPPSQRPPQQQVRPPASRPSPAPQARPPRPAAVSPAVTAPRPSEARSSRPVHPRAGGRPPRYSQQEP